MAEEEQALITRSIEAGSTTPGKTEVAGCAKDAPEMIHITSGCNAVAGRAYMKHHNQMA